MTLHLQPTGPGSDPHRLRVEFSRLLCDDGHSTSCPDGAGKSQNSRGVDDRTPAGLYAAWHIRQEGRGSLAN